MFRLGADDVLDSLFHVPILYAKLKAVMRRKKFNTRCQLHFGNFILDLNVKQLTVFDKSIKITQMEYDILFLLLSNRDSSITRASMIILNR
jgi:DNA-binding response OmpR family regulator